MVFGRIIVHEGRRRYTTENGQHITVCARANAVGIQINQQIWVECGQVQAVGQHRQRAPVAREAFTRGELNAAAAMVGW